ncbi:MAG: hypothetical protein BroJett030_22830 [Alphaproteobacteria bacterium]|nr:MAG: hypothetical protein BroJett030_22830 [Alphaproteobacteria bacterium]
MSKIARHSAQTLPPLTDAQKAALKALAELPDEAIEIGDIPELSKDDWRHAVRGRFYRPVKQQITARIDADVLAWLKAPGKGYQARLNAILRREMLAQRRQRS